LQEESFSFDVNRTACFELSLLLSFKEESLCSVRKSQPGICLPPYQRKHVADPSPLVRR